MEIDDQSTPENPDKVTSDEQAGASPVRSYDCTFCKRGFSNAQALGGHMNIHRKDKAKLKQASTNNQNQQPLNIPMILPYFSPNPTNIIRPSMEELKGGASQERSPGRWPWMLAEENDATNMDKTHREVRQLPLFVERTLTSDQNPSNQVRGNSEKLLSSTSSSGPELDLELRLGPEPGESSPSATGTKKFF